MKEDFTKYTLLELWQTLPFIKKTVDEYYKWTKDDHTTQYKLYKKWFSMYSRILVEISSRT
ncbi:hypothetical protein LCGC14_3147810 [marine sediment metagenome]|uniref:Uncharacterized protein n=1 Tax=marine sediment metagenome TaxID=412755 RepID=A0A0F8VV21_9ZZZZ